MIDWETTAAALWRSQSQQLRAVKRLDDIALDDLLGVDQQKRALIDNTEIFLSGKRANNALLWGARGTGKSSLIKALLNNYADRGLRLVEVEKDDLAWLPEITDIIGDHPYRFVVFCDDLSFEVGDPSYKGLKRILEGSIEMPPENLIVYATSNRRHLLPEFMEDNLASKVVGKEVHYSDAIEEKISLSDRFGLWLSFYRQTMDDYLQIVDHFFPDYAGDRAELHESAKAFALGRGSHSGRTARQFFLLTKTD